MSLSKQIEEIRTGIRTGKYANGTSVSQGIVLRLLNALGWPTYDTQVEQLLADFQSDVERWEQA